MRRSEKRARLRRASSFQRLQRLRESTKASCDVRQTLPDLVHLFCGRALCKLRVGKLCVKPGRLLLQLVALALKAPTLLREINQTFERHGHFRAARKHCPSRGARRLQQL